LTRASFLDGYFRPGDLGYMGPDGNLYITGRIGRAMNIGGVKVDPVEVERAVETLASVDSCHVDLVSNEHGGVIRARVVPRQGFQVTRRDVIQQCRQHLAEYKLPRIIEFVEQTPVSIGGKIRSGSSA
jgi:acyl-CoA synthetase (AMP-forming)/AMP-acid ligase II